MKRMLLTAALLTLSSVQAGGMDMAMPGMTHMTMPMTPSASVPGLSQMGLQMQLDMRMMMMPMISDLARLSGRSFERAFMSMMIPHHQSAIDSSRAVLERAKDEQVRAWATQIIADQTREIAEMQAQLRAYGGPNQAVMARMMQMNRMMDMPAMIRASSMPERTFLEGMLPHHAAANEKSNLALQRTQDPFVLELAKKIITAQAGEMHDFQGWLRAH
ncbi:MULTISPECIES: DUF305 domain-containing protein [Deinococcus]|jgi:uncharacterized protein (DUF305 family)|uniref:DUF305 domain-containing protein n=2 Tax=Deinococcus TaxID=1298 RepID=A0ABQ2JJS3_9DEIO|nr:MULTISPECIES: DUF305 domain-containing protein [Deinococcus]MCD0156174.1 DUF305 domain-containing protein [Deinococcus sp. 6GRE01]MCD0162326.1 DUF305 domain-containing protein [Deinococcus sp. 6YEL10]MCD0164044.1 DUF305 domain-containing protein [Deinococcus sp. 12RED42]MCD0174831.1 DUF305 domain-containing protein [Deinococcus sp. 14RED07]GGN47746.1 hypothetical protein GCM10010842_39520 [Deinococcus daejeonensis]